MNKTWDRILRKAELKLLAKREREALQELKELRARTEAARKRIAEGRLRKAEIIKTLFFRHRQKQKHIGELIDMRQGNVSRVISQQVYGNHRYYKGAA